MLPRNFATVVIASGGPQRFLTLPQTAVSYNPYGDTVVVVEESKGRKRESRPRRADRGSSQTARRAAIRSHPFGIKQGDTSSPQQIKRRSGFPGVGNHSSQPTNDPAPQPRTNKVVRLRNIHRHFRRAARSCDGRET